MKTRQKKKNHKQLKGGIKNARFKKIHERAIKIIELAEKEKWSEEELLTTIDLLHLQNQNYLPELSRLETKL